MEYQDYRTSREVRKGVYGCLTEGVDKFYAEILKRFHLGEQRKSARHIRGGLVGWRAKRENRGARLKKRKIFRSLFTPFLRNACPYILGNFSSKQAFIQHIFLLKV